MLKLSLTLCSDKIHQGGAVAAPVGGQVLSEILPYLELAKDNEKEEDKIEQVTVPEIRKISIKEAKNTLKEVGLELDYEEKEDQDINELIIKEQNPKPGIKVKKGSKISIEI